MHSKNLTLLTDLYELTMMQGYYDKQDNPTVIFDVFYRSNPFSSGYAIAAGLEQVIEYVKNLTSAMMMWITFAVSTFFLKIFFSI